MYRFSATIACQFDSPFSPYPAARWEDSLAWAQACGLEAVEPCISDYDTFELAALERALSRHGLGCSTISTGQAFGREGISLTHPETERRQAAIRRVEEHIAAAQRLGSCVTIGLLRGKETGESAAVLYERLCESMRPCVAAAKARGVRLLVEAINRYETPLLPNGDAVLQLICDLGAAGTVQVLWDLFHANIEDDDFAPAIARMGEHLGHVHLADSNRAFPYHGHIDFDGVCRQLLAAGFAGYLSLECLDAPYAGAIVEETPALVDRLRSL